MSRLPPCINVVADRFGFACNSSSAHSVVVLREGQQRPESVPAVYGGFGTDDFVLTTREEKLRYVAAAVATDIGMHFGYDHRNEAETVTRDYLKRVLGFELDEPEYGFPVIDHQSQPSFPRSMTGDDRVPDEEFITCWARAMLEDRVVILGGSDSDTHPLRAAYDEEQSLSLDGDSNPLYYETDGSHDIVRNDGTHWVIFDRSTGRRRRVRMGSNEQPTKAATPELVDVKITDYCAFGCKFCYQGSTLAGRAASIEDIESVAEDLAALKVFEVAIGGGEPTTHPEFAQVLRAFRKRGVVPNFTTKSLSWLSGPDKAAILSLVGGVAFSVENVTQARAVVAALEEHVLSEDDKITTFSLSNALRGFTLQVVEFVPTLDELIEIFRFAAKAKIGVTVLGYKTTGFGKAYPRNAYDWLPMILDPKTSGYYLDWRERPTPLNVDTLIAKRLLDQGYPQVDERFLIGDEGKFSMYIDVVEKRCAPSSFCDPVQRVPYTDASSLLEAFRQW